MALARAAEDGQGPAVSSEAGRDKGGVQGGGGPARRGAAALLQPRGAGAPGSCGGRASPRYLVLVVRVLAGMGEKLK